MTFRPKSSVASLLLSATVLISASCTVPTIAPGGAYSGDPFLLTVDKTIEDSKADIGDVLRWMQDNKALLAQNNKSALVAGEVMRTNTPTWLTNLMVLRDAFLVARAKGDSAATALQSNLLSGAVSSLQSHALSGVAITNSVRMPP